MNRRTDETSSPVADIRAEVASLLGLSEADATETRAEEERRETASEQRVIARLKGFEGDPCGECGNFTLVRNGTCLKCDTCGSTSGCS